MQMNFFKYFSLHGGYNAISIASNLGCSVLYDAAYAWTWNNVLHVDFNCLQARFFRFGTLEGVITSLNDSKVIRLAFIL